jgi:hypothetical protein
MHGMALHSLALHMPGANKIFVFFFDQEGFFRLLTGYNCNIRTCANAHTERARSSDHCGTTPHEQAIKIYFEEKLW